jgi:hypothetical protein
MSSSACWAQSFTRIDGNKLNVLSANGKWAFSFTVEDEESGIPGSIYLYDIENNTPVYYEGAPGELPYVDAVSDNGILAGSTGGNAALLINREWTLLPIPNDDSIFESTARGISADGSLVCGYLDYGRLRARIPLVWTLQTDGTYEYAVLPAPEKDFSNLTPQAVDALRISADGTVIAGRIVDYSGSFNLVIVWKKNAENNWAYQIIGESLIFNPGVELPFVDPESAPVQPDATDYFTAEDWEIFNQAIEDYLIARENTEEWWTLKNPRYYPEEYITHPDSIAAYNGVLNIYIAASDEFNKKMDAYYEVLFNQLFTGYSIDVYYLNISGNGRYITSSAEYPDPNPSGWLPSSLYSPLYFDLQTGEQPILFFAPNTMVYNMTDNGDLFYATPHLGQTKNSYVVPAGTTDASIGIADWILQKTNNQLNIKPDLLFSWDTVRDSLITGSIKPSADGKVFVSTFASPATGIPVSYVVSLGENVGIKTIEPAAPLKVYPNPASDVLYFDGQVDHILMTDLSGRSVFNGKPNNGSLPVASFNKGVYLVKIKSNDKISAHKIIIN